MKTTVSPPLQGLREETGWVSLTQAAGLGCVRSPLWGWEVQASISKLFRRIRTLPNTVVSCFLGKNFVNQVGPNGVRPGASAAGPYMSGSCFAALPFVVKT